MPEGGSQDLSVDELAADVQRLKSLIGSYGEAQHTASAEVALVNASV